MNEKSLENNKFMLVDLLAGDDSISKRTEFEGLSYEDMRKTIKTIIDNPKVRDQDKVNILSNLWKVYYRQKPPSVTEFMSDEWLGSTSLSLFPQVKTTLAKFWAPDSPHRHLILAPCIGWGKLQRNDAKVFTPSGFKLVGNLQIGDIVSTPNGKTAKVIRLYPHDIEDIYEITFKDGRKTYAGLDHLWKVTQSTHSRGWGKNYKKKTNISTITWKVLNTKEIIENGLFRGNKTKSPKWKIPLTNPVYHEERDHFIKPYTLGCLLGDGYLLGGSITFTSTDKDIIDKLYKECPEDCSISHNSKSIHYLYTKKHNKKFKLPSFLNKELKLLNLLGKKSHTKFIPKEYLFDSVENRVALLQGLMDTDGTVDKQGRISFSTNSSQLRDDIILLVRGLGGLASWKIHKRKKRSAIEFYVFISFPNNKFPIFSLARKQERVNLNFNRKRNRSNTQLLSIINIKKVEPAKATCILLDDEDHLYLTDDYIVTHNSVTTAISVLYTMVHLNLMKNPKQFFNLAQASSIIAVLGSFTLAKAKQTLLKPFIEILQTSKRFRRVRSEERIALAQQEENNDKSGKIVWSTASTMEGALQFSNDLHIIIVSNLNNLLGLNIITGALTEISFFLNQGVSAEEISQMYNDLKGRVWSRFGTRYFATTILDSSPNSFDSPIDKYVFEGEAEKDPLNLVVTSTHWDAHPYKYPIWQKTGETFNIFRGTNGKPPTILNDTQIIDYSPTEIIKTPIDLYNLASQDLSKVVKDFCGWPSGSHDKLINNFSVIDNMFSNQLRNIYTYIKAPADQRPERLIWDQIVKQFFIEVGHNHYEFYRAPKEVRYIHIDLAESGDIASIGSVHPELYKDGNIIVITDFLINILPGNDRINLQAVENFIVDLRDLGKFNIEVVTYDQYQSSTARQNLEREGFKNVERFSVDSSTIPYYVYISWLKNGRIKSGRNIFLRNNLKSIHEIVNEETHKKKIDHLKGKLVYDDGGKWETSLMGINAKDTSDAHCGSSYHCITTFKGIPIYQWEDDDTFGFSSIKQKVINQVYNKYSYIIKK